MEMRVISFVILAIALSTKAYAFDLKNLGGDLTKGLGGALKQLETELNKGTQGSNSNQTQSNDTPVKPQKGDATAQIVNGLCVVTYIASDGSEHIQRSTAQDCEQAKRTFLLNGAKDIEKVVQRNQEIERSQAEEAKKQADAAKEERERQQFEKDKKLAEVRAKQDEIAANSKPLDPAKLIPKDKNTRKFTKEYPDDQKLFLAEFWEYRGLMTKYYESKFDANVSEREGDKALNLAYDKFVLKFYKDGGKRQETGDGNPLKEYPFPLSALHFSYSDNIGQSINDWKCYVPPRHPDTGKQSICEIVWETTLRGEKTMVNIPVLVDVRGYGDFHESVIGKNPKRYVGDQLSLSASDFWLFGEVMGADNDLGWDSTLLTMVVVDPTWKISIEDAVKYDPKKKKWVFR